MTIKKFIQLFLLFFIAVIFFSCAAEKDALNETAAAEALPAITIRQSPLNDTTIYDTVILNARLINPETGTDMVSMNIGILDGKIAALTRRPLQGARIINADGLIAAPGFIDILSFELDDVAGSFKISDGVTTNLVMHGGTVDAKTWYAQRAQRPYFVNYGASSFITLMRQPLGYWDRNVMTNPAHIEILINNVRRNITDGALGVSMSPEYCPGLLGAEMLALSHLAAEMGATTFYHLRYSTPTGPNNSLDGIQEVIDLARITGASTHIEHIASTGATHVADQALAMVAAAIAEGLDFTSCVYPYDYWASNVYNARFDPGWQQRFNLTYNDLQIPNTTIRLTAESFALYRREGKIVLARGSIPEEEVRLVLKQPYVMIGSDEIMTANSHPRGAGTFSRVIGHYARDLGIITLMEAITKMTIMPARRLESISDDIKRKGRLEIGADADIVLFDYNTIIDTATAEESYSHSKGIIYVLVNGVVGVDNTEILRIRAGQPVRSRYASPAASLAFTNYDISVSDSKEIESQAEFAGIVAAFNLFGRPFADLKQVSEILQTPYVLAENGEITFGQARLTLGETAFTSYEQESHLLHEPVIYRGSVYLPIEDLPDLVYGLVYSR